MREVLPVGDNLFCRSHPGDEIVCVVNKARPITQGVAAGNIQKVRKGDVRRAVIVRTRKPIQRPDGRIIR